MKILLSIILLLTAAAAQTVNITGTVQDSQGNVYINGSGKVDLVPSNQQWLFNGTNPVNSPVPIAQLSSTGQFSIQLINTSLISPSSANPQWQFSFCSNAQLTKVPICFTMTPMVLTSSQDISSQIKSQAAILPSTSKGGCIATVSTLSSSCGTVTGTVASVTDGSNSSDCSIGGGTATNVCIYTGTIWTFAGSASTNPTFGQVGSGTNSNALLVAGSMGPVTTGTIIATSLNSAYIDWNASSGGAFIQNKPALNIWSNLLSAQGNLNLNLYQTPTSPFTSKFTAGDFGVSPVSSGITNYTTVSTSSTDNSFLVGFNTPANTYQNPLEASVGPNQIFGVCSTGGGATNVGYVMVGQFTPNVTCATVAPLSPLSRLWSIVGTGGHTAFTAYDGVGGYTGNLVQFNAHTVAGTGFNFLTTCAGIVNTTPTTCPLVLDTIRGDGLLIVPSFELNGSTPLTSVQGNGVKLQAATGTATAGNCAQFDSNLNLISAANPCGSGGGGSFPSGVGIAGATTSGTGIISQIFLPPVDVRLFFTTPYPTYAQAQSQDFGAVLNAAFVAATASGACVDLQGLNYLNAPNVTVLFASTNPYAGLTSNTYTPCVINANLQVVTGATWSTPSGSLSVRGAVPGGIGGTGMVVQPCNTTGNCAGSGGFNVTQFPNSSQCSTNGGLQCYATGLPSSPSLTTYSTGTVAYTLNSTTVTGTGVTWTTSMVGGTLVSACPANSCTIGSTSGYTTGRIVAVSGSTITLDSGWTAATASGQNYVIFKPNTAVVWCDGCLKGSLQKSFTGHEIDDLTIDLNGIAGAGFYVKSSQEGSILNDYTCFLQFNTSTAASQPGGTCLAWDQTVRESSNGNQTFLGHWSVKEGRIGMGQNAGGSLAFGVVVEGFSLMDGTVALSQSNGPSVFELQADIGGSGSARFQDGVYLDGFSGMFLAGQHTEGVLNNNFNVGPVNPVYNLGIYNVTSSGTLGNSVIEFHTLSSGNQVHGVSRPSGGVLITDDNLTTPIVATAVSGTPASWTFPEYVQQGNNGVAIAVSGNITATGTVSANQLQWVGPPNIAGPCPASPMSPTALASAIGVSNDCYWYESNSLVNSGAISKIATLAYSNTWTANQNLTGEITINAHDIAIPLVCADSSGSGTAQVCNTTPTFTPVAGDCMTYTTTTSNTGTSLTINWNGLTKNVAKWQTSTTLVANDVRANTYPKMCYDGTNFEIDTIGNIPSGGGTGTIGCAAGNYVSVVGTSDLTAQSSSQASTIVATTPGACNYNLRYYADVNTGCTTGANSVSFTLNWTDATAARSLNTGSLSLASSGTSSYLSGEVPIRVASGNVTYTSTISGSCASGSSSYDIHMVLTQ